ncbi:MAG: serine/threonine protein kinase [Planctomycetes bacterium]|nr:serine/threonine protein kinase [Planctomycetota bacterium]
MIDWEEFYQSFRKPGFIPGYEIQNRLGGGAFGEVYKARKTSIGKPYAVKFLKVDDQSGREAVERELDHVRHFAQIDHPNLVTIEDMGVVLGVPYLIMGYAGEDTLARRQKRERLGVERALHYFTQTARGVLALHDRKLVHFDLKPSNIFLKGEIARVGDYGLAKLMTDGRSTLSFGRGTPHYMAPEMLKNRADHRADIYSLGVILHESIAGALPFEQDSGGGFVVREDDDPPQFAPDFPIALRAVVERCLRLDPSARFDSVEELVAELGQTGRQGDSIVVPRDVSSDAPRVAGEPRARTLPDFTPPPTPTPEPAKETPIPVVESTPTAPARGVARATSRELARGAAEVAMGVWEGLRSVRQNPASPERTDAHSPSNPTSLQVAPAAALAATVPVPPRVEGGLLRRLLSTFALGLEVLVALIVAPVRRAVFGAGRAGHGFVARGRGWFGVTWRLMLLGIALVGIGCAVALAAFLAYVLLIG